MAGDIPAFALGALVAGGGITGFVRAGSIPSLTAGSIIGLLYAIGGLRMRNRQTYGVEMALLASLALFGSQAGRAARSQKPLPIALTVLGIYGLFTFGQLWRAGASK